MFAGLLSIASVCVQSRLPGVAVDVDSAFRELGLAAASADGKAARQEYTLEGLWSANFAGCHVDGLGIVHFRPFLGASTSIADSQESDSMDVGGVGGRWEEAEQLTSWRGWRSGSRVVKLQVRATDSRPAAGRLCAVGRAEFVRESRSLHSDSAERPLYVPSSCVLQSRVLTSASSGDSEAVVAVDLEFDLYAPTLEAGSFVDVVLDDRRHWTLPVILDRSALPVTTMELGLFDSEIPGQQITAWVIVGDDVESQHVVVAPTCCDLSWQSDGEARPVLLVAERVTARSAHECRSAIIGVRVRRDTREWQLRIPVRHTSQAQDAAGTIELRGVFMANERVAIVRDPRTGRLSLAMPDRIVWCVDLLVLDGREVLSIERVNAAPGTSWEASGGARDQRWRVAGTVREATSDFATRWRDN
jgi:hypothetical protein